MAAVSLVVEGDALKSWIRKAFDAAVSDVLDFVTQLTST
jgi:hypothetical protein